MKKKDKKTEQEILLAARKEFIEKGLAGSRMQDIANRAGYNKALLHYYFTSKKKLFDIVFEMEIGDFFSHLGSIMMAELPLFEKIERIVSMDIDRLTQFPGLPNFMLNEMSHNPDIILKRLRKLPMEKILHNFQKQINAELKIGSIKKISAQQLIINIQSLCVFPFIAKPMIKGLLQMDEKVYLAMIQKRKTEVAAFIINAIKI